MHGVVEFLAAPEYSQVKALSYEFRKLKTPLFQGAIQEQRPHMKTKTLLFQGALILNALI